MAKHEKIVSALFIIMTIGILVILNIDVSGHKMKFMDNKINIKSDTILINDITNIELLDEVFIGSKIKGTNTLTYNRGTYSLGNDTKGKVYVYNKSKPFIRITTKDKIIIYNDKDSEQTKETYNKLVNICNINPNNDINTTIVPSDSKYTDKEKNNDKIVTFLTLSPTVIMFLGVGIYSLRKKTPMHFWAGSVVKSEEISDIKAYNKANGIMWIVCGLSFILIPLLSETIGGIVVTFLVLFEVIGMIICYQIIYNKYKVK